MGFKKRNINHDTPHTVENFELLAKWIFRMERTWTHSQIILCFLLSNYKYNCYENICKAHNCKDTITRGTASEGSGTEFAHSFGYNS